jgi:hypothetical protein
MYVLFLLFTCTDVVAAVVVAVVDANVLDKAKLMVS